MTFTFGEAFRIHIFGESHGHCVGVVIDGCPPGVEINLNKVQQDLDTRRPGQSTVTSTRNEEDRVSVLSGLFRGKTTQAPLVMMIPNTDVDSSNYEAFKDTPRPGTADYTARIKYDAYNDYRGSGVFSGRMTAPIVAAGSIAKQLLVGLGIEVVAHVVQVGKIRVERQITDREIKKHVYTNEIRCADSRAVAKMKEEIARTQRLGDSVGGIVECRVLDVPIGIGEPFFDSVESVMSHAMFSIPGVKGIEFGSGFLGAAMLGSENNDPFAMKGRKVVLLKNDAGGILGGISNGQPIVFRLAFKPTPSINRSQTTVNLKTNKETTIGIQGRHDPSIVPRALPAVEGLAALVIADLVIRASCVLDGMGERIR